MKNRILSLLTTLVMVVGFVGVIPSVSAGALTSGDFEYDVLEDGTVEITGYTGNATELNIPSEISVNKVTSIGNYAFEDCSSLTNITIPNSVTHIGFHAFFDCDSLKNVTIPDSVIHIEGGAFGFIDGDNWGDDIKIDNYIIYCYSNTAGEKYAIENEFNYNVIGQGTTKPYDDYDYLILLNDTIEITNYTGNATELNIPSEINGMVVGSVYFSNLESKSNIQIINIPDSIIDGDIEPDYISDAFELYDSLTDINVDEDNKKYSSIDGVLYNKSKTDLLRCPRSKREVNIPESVTRIGTRSFENCNNLKIITMPNSVTYIGAYFFYNCDSLTSVIISNSVKYIGEANFSDCDRLESVLIPSGVTSIGLYSFSNCTTLEQIILPNSVTTIGYYSFNYCDSLTSAIIPNSVTTIYEGSFNGCVNLTDVYYSGTEEEWNNIDIQTNNDELLNATIHFNSTGLYDPTEPYLGDLSGDGKITTVDVGIINSFAKGTKEYTDEQFKLADANSDGKITTVDVGLINKIAKSA